MKVLIFGATGMVGQGVLRECLLDPDVSEVVTIGRSATGQSHARLREIVHADLTDYTAIEPQLTGFDACFFCLGIASVGMSEADYRRITYDITLAAAGTLVRLNPAMVFVYVSGASTDSSEKGRWMWARVKGATENAIMRLPFRASYMFRPGAIQPLHGIRSKTRLYRVIYDLTAPLLPLLQRWLPNSITTTEQIGKAMLKVAKDGAPKPILENADINRL
ncbi:NAD-dependent epimerase/dehydratase family protein [Bosea sp. 685]|uniref:NAD-dependent epimerase/dehydratase family protein n=1 Tax=Bosea sp. 685 TaxID=3080057 RepID=UPI002892E37A|nr:NAD-dependent epimerase/dehydratase family protein [Bosea sp. 685]WNJ89026.1 NAD-dependent epimerase/dehydratase family protein [Bosea sp. 685]